MSGRHLLVRARGWYVVLPFRTVVPPVTIPLHLISQLGLSGKEIRQPRIKKHKNSFVILFLM